MYILTSQRRHIRQAVFFEFANDFFLATKFWRITSEYDQQYFFKHRGLYFSLAERALVTVSEGKHNLA